MSSFKNRPIKVLWHGEFGFHTGFAGVSENILDRLWNIRTDWGTQKFAPAVMALGQQVNPFDNQQKKPYQVIPMYGNRGAAPFGQDYAADLVRRFKPDIVVTFGDTWMSEFWNDPGVIPEDLRKTFKLVGYIAIDGYPIPKTWINSYRSFDKVVAFTEFGRDAIQERADQMDTKINLDQIYHGVNNQIFKPLPRKDVDMFKKQRNLDGKKIIGMFSRNQPRKHHPEFIELAKEILKATNNDPDIRFYFHTVERDAGWSLPDLLDDVDDLGMRDRFVEDGMVGPEQDSKTDEIKLKDRFIFPGIQNPAQGMPIEMLNMMYNICDVHVLLTSGEGFGCTLLESMAAGIPTFTNDYAAGAELVKSAGQEVFKARAYSYRGSDHNFYRPHTDYEDAVSKILPVINDEEVKKKYAKKAKAFAMGMSWDIINDDWDRVLSSVYDLDPEDEYNSEVI